MLSLFLDAAVFNLTEYHTFFVLLPIVIFSYKKEWLKIIIMGIVLDMLMDVYLLNIISFVILYLFNKIIFKYCNFSFKSFLLTIFFNYLLFILFMYVINNIHSFSLIYYFKYILSNLFLSLIYYLLNYKCMIKLRKKGLI